MERHLVGKTRLLDIVTFSASIFCCFVHCFGPATDVLLLAGVPYLNCYTESVASFHYCPSSSSRWGWPVKREVPWVQTHLVSGVILHRKRTSAYSTFNSIFVRNWLTVTYLHWRLIMCSNCIFTYPRSTGCSLVVNLVLTELGLGFSCCYFFSNPSFF